MVSEGAIAPGDPRRPPARRGLLPRPPPDHLRRDQGAVRALRAGRRAHRHRAPRPARRARRRPAARTPSPTLASTVPGGRATHATTPRSSSRTRCCGGCSAAAQSIQTSVARARGRARGARRAGRAAAVQGRPRGAGERLPPGRGGPRRGDRPPRGALQGRHRADRDAVRLPRPRRDDRRLPARQPDRDRGQAGDGKVSRSSANIAENVAVKHGKAGRLLLARDVGDRAGPPLHRLPGADRERPAAQGQGRDARTGRGSCEPATSSSRRRCGSTTPRTSACSTCGPRRGACTPQRGRARPGDRRLPAADAGRGPAPEPGRAGRRRSAAA